ncbi:MAG TPA: hypothetical protein VF794_08335 [Archangium sp.]|uniref:hypothetical protein n=1 Tax=Archangium sp. TaxID=1872627 RepID=UPI002ED8A179
MATTLKTRRVLAGLLAGSLALGTGCKRAEAEAHPQDLLQQQDEQRGRQEGDDTTTREEGGTGGAGDAGTGSVRQFEGTFEEPGTGGGGNDDTVDEGALDEPGTGGAGDTDTWNEGLRDEDEGVLQPGVNDEGLDNQDPTLDEPDTGTRDAR